MKHRSVVANFLFRWSNQEQTQQQVALFHRSRHPNIRSYQGKYAPVSGSIEVEDPNPLLAAKREIQEETQLTPDHDIVLEFCGKSYSFEDEQAGRSWTVHPFGWILKANDDKIKIDWEHDSWAWFDPQEILDGSRHHECVPKLDESLQRVFFGPNGMFRGGGYLIGRTNTAGMRFLDTIEQVKRSPDRGPNTPGLTALEGLYSIAECFRACPVIGGEAPDYWHALSLAAYHFIYSTRPGENGEISLPILAALEEVAQTLDSGALNPVIASAILKTHLRQQQTQEITGGDKSERGNILQIDVSERKRLEEKLFGDLYS